VLRRRVPGWARQTGRRMLSAAPDDHVAQWRIWK
jgi:hypothetical protein